MTAIVYSIEIKDDELSIPLTSLNPSRPSEFLLLRGIIGLVGFLLILIPLARLFILGDDDGLWLAIVGTAMLCWVVNYNRKLILRRREFVAESRLSVIWPIRSVKRSLEEYSAIMVRRFVAAGSDSIFTTHQVHLVGEDEDEVGFHCGSWWSHDEAVAAGAKVAKFLNLALIDACSDETERIEPYEHELTQAQRTRHRGEFDFPEPPDELVTEIDFAEVRTSLFIPAPGLSTELSESWGGVVATVFLAVFLLWLGKGIFPGVLALAPLVVWIYFYVLHLIFCTFNEEEIRVSDGLLTIEQRRPLGFGETTVYQTADVCSVYTRNMESESVIVVKSADQETLLGSVLSRKETRYVCAVIQAAMLKVMPVEETAGAHAS